MSDDDLKTLSELLQTTLARGTLDGLPLGTLPENILAAQIEDEIDYQKTGDRAAIEAEYRTPGPMLRFDWGYMVIAYADAEDDTEALVNVHFFVTATFEDADLAEALADILPDALEDVDSADLDNVINFSVGDGDEWSSADIYFFFDDAIAPIADQWKAIGAYLAKLVPRLPAIIQESLESATDSVDGD